MIWGGRGWWWWRCLLLLLLLSFIYKKRKNEKRNSELYIIKMLWTKQVRFYTSSFVLFFATRSFFSDIIRQSYKAGINLRCIFRQLFFFVRHDKLVCCSVTWLSTSHCVCNRHHLQPTLSDTLMLCMYCS